MYEAVHTGMIGIHHYNYRKAASDEHHLSSDIFDMDSQVEELKLM
jgi:hypothetical protein